ncbi:MAG: uroporphyrinogen-III synthase [Saprospiraceae bacterium]|nr:uroporphyrinogen-III synthase [Saprospiraceae bacterium]
MYRTKNVFISRNLSAGSNFYSLLPDNVFITGRSLIQLTPISFPMISNCDWIFFYSKNAVQFFFDHAAQSSLVVTQKIGALGQATASRIIEYGFVPAFVGKGKPEEVAAQFAKICTGRVLFPRAENSKQSIEKLLPSTVEIIPLILYKNAIADNFYLPAQSFDILVFTSPMNVQAYCLKYQFWAHQKIVAIGETTQAEILKYKYFNNITVAKEPSEMALIEAVLSVLI